MVCAMDDGHYAAAVVSVIRDVGGDRGADLAVMPVLFSPHIADDTQPRISDG
jgi:hypothetical protein